MFEVKTFLSLLMLALLCHGASSDKILVVVTVGTRSHYNLAKGIADVLHESGHAVTLISPYSSEKPEYREIVVPDIISIQENFVQNVITLGNTDFITIAKGFLSVGYLFEDMSKATHQNPGVQKLLNSDEEFELVVLHHIYNDEFIGLGVRFDCPVILTSPMSLMVHLAQMTGNPVYPGDFADLSSPYGNKMSLWERTGNTLLVMFQYLFNKLYAEPTLAARYKTMFPKEAALVPFSELRKKVAMIYSNTHASIQGPRPLLPNVAEIGGFHIGDVKPLSNELQTLLDNAKDGAIFFSMGSNIKGSSMTPELRSAILKTFGRLKETIIWKFEEEITEKPNNVFINKWLPQSGILAHKNVKFFITHGGLLSRTEAIKYGVPLLSIPVSADQSHNARITEEMGHGIWLKLANITEDTFSNAIQEMLTNPVYKEKASKLAELFSDRPISPRDLIVFTADHVIRNRGAAHLSTPDVGLFKKYLLDVIGFVLILISFIVYLFKLVLRIVGSGDKKLKPASSKKDVSSTPDKKIKISQTKKKVKTT